MVVGFTERSPQSWQLQMAARLAVRNKKQAITRERELFSEITICDRIWEKGLYTSR